jgi:uncharacterized phage-associated protein
MAVDARSVANEILVRAWDMGFEPTQIDIQKISYFLHGHHLIDHGVPMIKTEFEAFQYGPVQSVLLDEFRRWGDEPIRDLATKFDPVRRTREKLPQLEDNSIMETIDKYLALYLEVPTFVMVDVTHSQGTPWSRTMQAARKSVNIGMKISDDLIRSCFEGGKFA